MVLWIIAVLAGAVLLAGLAFLTLRKDEEEEDAWGRPRHAQPWDQPATPPDPIRSRTLPPPAGFPSGPTGSEELSASHYLESQELWVDDDDEPTGPVPRIVVRAAGETDPGKRREHNEDAFLVLPEHEVYAVADGMGGYAAGEIASAIAVSTIRDCFEAGHYGEVLAEGYPRRGAELMSAIRVANARIRADAATDEAKTGMGTTIVSARFSAGRKRVYIAHVGDSRCYRVRDGHIEQLTHDHTLGAIGITGPSAGKLSRAVGVFDDVDVDLTVDEPQPGDFYLLCSDGLYKMVTDAMILSALADPEGVASAADRLIASANERGGRDNVSVVVIRVDDPGFDPGQSGAHRLPG